MRLRRPILHAALPIKVGRGAAAYAPRDQSGLWFRFVAKPDEEAVIVRIQSAREPDVCAIVLGAARAFVDPTKMPSRVVVDSGISEAVAGSIVIARRAIHEARLACCRCVFVFRRFRKTAARYGSRNLKCGDGFRIDPKPPIDGDQLIVLLNEVIAGREQAEARILFSNVTLHPQHGNVSVLPEKARVHRIGLLFGGEIARRIIAGNKKAEGIASALAG